VLPNIDQTFHPIMLLSSNDQLGSHSSKKKSKSGISSSSSWLRSAVRSSCAMVTGRRSHHSFLVAVASILPWIFRVIGLFFATIDGFTAGSRQPKTVFAAVCGGSVPIVGKDPSGWVGKAPLLLLFFKHLGPTAAQARPAVDNAAGPHDADDDMFVPLILTF